MGPEFFKSDSAESWQEPSTGLRVILQVRNPGFGVRMSLSFLRENRAEDELMQWVGTEQPWRSFVPGGRWALDHGGPLNHDLFSLSPRKAVLGVISYAGPLRR